MPAFDIKEIEKLFKGMGGGNSAKSQAKAQKELAKRQAKMQKEIAQMQIQASRELAAQQAAASLEMQNDEQSFKQPFMRGELMGSFDGELTLAGRQHFEGARQFDEKSKEDKRQFDLSHQLEQEIQQGRLDLDRLSQQQDNAIAQGQLDLARQIETQKVALQEQLQTAQIKLQQSDQSGFLDNGQLTEAARAARVREGLESGQLTLQQVQTMGRDASGNLTDASQQWRTSAGLEAAQIAAQLGANPADYFQSAAFLRDPRAQEALGFLDAAGQGSSMGFRAASTGLPQTGSIEALRSGPGMIEAGAPKVQQPGYDPTSGQYAMIGGPMPADGAGLNPAQAAVVAALSPDGRLSPQQALALWNDLPASHRDDLIARSPDLQRMGASNRWGFDPAAVSASPQQPVAGGYMLNTQQNVAGLQGATDGPSPSVSAAQAAAGGADAAFTKAMHTAQADLNFPAGFNPSDIKRRALAGDPEAMAQYQAQLAKEAAVNQTGGAMLNGPVQEAGGTGNAYMGPISDDNVNSIQPIREPVGPAPMPGPYRIPGRGPDAAQQRLAQIQSQVVMPGAHKLAPGTMESWSPTEKGLVASGLKASGINPADFEAQYQRSRLQTNVGATAI